MCTVLVHSSWEKLKNEFPNIIDVENGKEYIKTWKLLVWHRLAESFTSLFYDYGWTPGKLHQSSRKKWELSEGEINIYEGFHSSIHPLNSHQIAETLMSVYQAPISFYEQFVVFPAKVYKEDFVCWGYDGNYTHLRSVVSTKIFIGNVYFKYYKGKLVETTYRQD